MQCALVQERHCLYGVNRKTGIRTRGQTFRVHGCIRAAPEPIPNAIGSEEPAQNCVALTLGFAACASSGKGSGTPRSAPDKITRSEIAASNVMDAYELIDRLRPDWFRGRGTASIGGGRISRQIVLVYLDGHRLGDLTALRTLSVGGIDSIQWLDATRAETVLSGVGSDPIAGAIVIKSQ